MSDVYLIKKETLNAIAREMVNLAPDYISADGIITPEDMARRMYEVKDQGYDEGYNDGGNTEEAFAEGYLSCLQGGRIPNLKGSTWVFNHSVALFSNNVEFNVDFISNNKSFSRLTVFNKAAMKYDETFVTSVISGWVNAEYQKVSFTGGADIKNTNLIDWLYSNAELQASFSADLEALGELCEWQVTTDSDSLPVVTIVNHHPSYYMHYTIEEYIDDELDDIYDGVVLPADSDTVSFGKELSERYQIYVTNVRWSASAT